MRRTARAVTVRVTGDACDIVRGVVHGVSAEPDYAEGAEQEHRHRAAAGRCRPAARPNPRVRSRGLHSTGCATQRRRRRLRRGARARPIPTRPAGLAGRAVAPAPAESPRHTGQHAKAGQTCPGVRGAHAPAHLAAASRRARSLGQPPSLTNGAAISTIAPSPLSGGCSASALTRMAAPTEWPATTAPSSKRPG